MRPFLGVLLAGGRGARMGEPKATLPWPGGTLASAGLARLAPLCLRVAVARGAVGTGDLPPGVIELADALPEAGPLGAMVPGLELAAAAGLVGLLVVPCDMPLVSAAELLPLMEAVEGGADAALWRLEGRLQPLCAAYAAHLAPGARALFEAGARRPVALLGPDATGGRDPRVEELQPAQNSAVRLMNVNRRSDYDLALRRFHESQGRSSQGPGGPDPG